MLNKRIIPCLLLNEGMFVKTIQFSSIRHISEPIYAIKIFNDYEVDELMIVDINRSRQLFSDESHVESLPFDLISKISDESCMPIAYGGGICSIEEIQSLFRAGVEKVCICTEAAKNPEFIKKAASIFGSQSIVVAIDVLKTMDGEYEVWINGGMQKTAYRPVEYARMMQDMGAGELLINAISRDGTMQGYDISLVRSVSDAVSVPVIALGGAGSYNDLSVALREGGASAAAAGSIFVYFGKKKAVLINYPDSGEIADILSL